MSYRKIKHWCIDNWENCTLIFIDDKAKILVGEAAAPEVATTHMRKVVTRKNVTLEASDHNYHMIYLTPSGPFIRSIKTCNRTVVSIKR